MNDEPQTPLDLASIKMDLERSFLPGWAKESDTAERSFPEPRGGAGGEQRRHGPRRGGPRRDFDERRGPRGDGQRRPSHRDSRSPRAPVPVAPRPPEIHGWDLRFKPDPRGVDGVAKHIRAGAKAYRLFDIAWLVLEKAERYRVDLRRTAEGATALFQLRLDGSIWLSEREAAAHALAKYLEKFYRKDRVATDPPKGVYPFVAVCGMSGVILGPPNYHDYQAKLRKIHGERFPNIPFDVYKSRVRIDRDEASIQRWKEEQSSKDEFYPLEESGESPLAKLASSGEVERHFLAHHASKCISRINERALVPGAVALGECTPAVSLLVGRAIEEFRRFPLPLAHTLGQQLKSKGLHIFKAHQNVTYVSVAQPRYLDRKAMPVADGVNAILEYLERHASTPRADQWKELLARRSAPAGATEADRESALAADLLWLLREGHVIDFARRGLEVATQSRPVVNRPPERSRHRPKKKPGDDKVAAAPLQAGQPEAATTPDPESSKPESPAETAA